MHVTVRVILVNVSSLCFQYCTTVTCNCCGTPCKPHLAMRTHIVNFQRFLSGKSKGGLSKRGLGPKGANWAKKGPFGAISPLPPWRWGAEESVPIGPEKAPIGPEKDPISPEKARFPRKDFPPIFSENLGFKPPFVSPPLDFPYPWCIQASSMRTWGKVQGETRLGATGLRASEREEGL